MAASRVLRVRTVLWRSRSRCWRKGADQHRVEILEGQLRRGLAGAALREAQQQPERVAIGGHRVRAGSKLGPHPLGEETLQGGRERAHAASPTVASRRAATRVSNSGAADRYQYVLPGWTWPR